MNKNIFTAQDLLEDSFRLGLDVLESGFEPTMIIAIWRGAVAVHGLNYVIKKICHDDRVLIVDDVFDTGNTIVAVIEEIRKRARDNSPQDIRVAVPWFKPERNQTDMTPDFFLRETGDWLVFPHELAGLEIGEIGSGKKDLGNILDLFE